MRKNVLTVVAVLFALIGLIWFGQGIGVIHGSVMTDDRKWAVIGIVMIIAGAGMFWFSRRK